MYCFEKTNSDYDFSKKCKKRKICNVEDDDMINDSNNKEEKEKKSSKKPIPHLSESDLKSRCVSKENHIYFFAGVSKESVYNMNDHLLRINENFKSLQRKNPTVKIEPKPIYLHINSFGGSIFAAFAAIDFIQQSNIPVYTVIEGATASAGTLISIVGKKRFIRPNACMLIHQLSSWFGGKMTEIEDEYQNLKMLEDKIKNFYFKHTKITPSIVEDLLKHDLWWDSEKCLEYGLIDTIWKGNESELENL
tara:strand:+ start:208 stop:954 length:747 start_codon:yes stop_codon:yes gene_type:complete